MGNVAKLSEAERVERAALLVGIAETALGDSLESWTADGPTARARQIVRRADAELRAEASRLRGFRLRAVR